jgi:hypothetical protein
MGKKEREMNTNLMKSRRNSLFVLERKKKEEKKVKNLSECVFV